MKIGQAAKISGVNAKLIRHYETIGVIPKATRSDSGYRNYTDSDVHILTFVKSARRLGFSMKEIKKLVSLWKNKTRLSSDVRTLALSHIKELESRIIELESMVKTLRNLASKCRGNERPDCPILEELARPEPS